MSFSAPVKEQALVACARHCCICHKFAGLKIECHHIILKSEGGQDDFENCIPLCFDCHAEQSSYDHRHPKGTKYTPSELKSHRDNWYTKVKDSPVSPTLESSKVDREMFDRVRKMLPANGSILFVKQNNFAGYAFEGRKLDEVRDFLSSFESPDFEFVDVELESILGDLRSALASFMRTIAMKTYPDHQSGWFILPEEFPNGENPSFWDTVEQLGVDADLAGSAYDRLIKTGRRKLLS